MDDERSVYALLIAPFFIMAFAIAYNASVQSKLRLNRILSRPSVVTDVREAKPVLHTKPFVDLKPVLHDVLPSLLAGSFEPPLQKAIGAGQYLSASAGYEDFRPANLDGVLLRSISPMRAGDRALAPQAAHGVNVRHNMDRDSRLSPFPTNASLGQALRHVAGIEVEHLGDVKRGEALSIVRAGLEKPAHSLIPDDIAVLQTPLSSAVVSSKFESGLVWPVTESRTVSPHEEKVFLSPVETVQMVRTRVAVSALALIVLMDGDGRVIAPERNICVADHAVLAGQAQSAKPVAFDSDKRGFGLALAHAALKQTKTFVIYNDKYMPIRYPMGDVPSLYGVCTDVVIRAYRELGIDLQELVSRSGIGSGDRSINHRRTRTLKLFFERFGDALTVTHYPEDYLPGDIVTYYRPQNRGSQMHIGIVADVVAASGRPMLIHNRGWGPQLEDALFVDEITGHFRYHGTEPDRLARLARQSR